MKLPTIGATSGVVRAPDYSSYAQAYAQGSNNELQAKKTQTNQMVQAGQYGVQVADATSKTLRKRQEASAQEEALAKQEINNAQYNEATASKANATNDFELNIKGKEQIDMAYVNEEIKVSRFRTETQPDGSVIEVPITKANARDVYPSMEKLADQNATLDASLLIEDVNLRNEWLQKNQLADATKNVNTTLSFRKQREALIKKEQIIGIDNQILAGNFESAMELAVDFQGTPENVASQVAKVKKQAELSHYDKAVTQGNLPELKRSLAYLETKTSANLTSDEQRLNKNMIQGAIKKIETQRERAVEQTTAQTNVELKKMTNILSSGKPIKPSSVMQLVDKVKFEQASGVKPTETRVEAIRKFQRAIEMNPEITEFGLTSHTEQADLITKLTNEADTVEEYDRLAVYESAYQQNQTARRNDRVQASNDEGNTIMKPLERDNTGLITADSWKGRESNAMVTDSKHNVDGSPLLTKAESVVFRKDYNAKTTIKKVEQLNSISSSMDRKGSNRLWKQVAGEGDESMAMAGDFISEGQPEIAHKYLKGLEIMQNRGESMKGYKAEGVQYVSSKIGNNFAGSSRLHKRSMQATEAIYAGLLADAQDYSGVFNEDLADRAVEMAIGNTAEIGGAHVILPERDMASETFKDFTSSFTYEYTAQTQGGLENYPSPRKISQLQYEIDSGKVILNMAGKNSYFLFSVADGKNLQGKDGKAYRLEYNTDRLDAFPNAKVKTKLSTDFPNREAY